MQIKVINDKEEMIFRKDFDGKKTYSLGLSRKDKNDNYINGYISAVFRKDVELQNKTKIKIKDAWLSFNVKDKKTYPYIFINDFEIVLDNKEEDLGGSKKQSPYIEFGNSIKTESNIGQQIQIEDEDLPF